MPASVHTVVSVNCQWPGFSKSPPWGSRGVLFANAIKKTAAGLVLAQELGWNRAHTFAYSGDLVARLGKTWTHHRAQGGGLGLNCVAWDRDVWEQDGDQIDINLPSYGQMVRTFIAVPLEHVRTGEKITAGSTHFANTGAVDLNVKPLVAQTKQAEAVIRALGTRRRVILGIDANNRTNLFGGRRALTKAGFAITGNGIDIIATRPGVTVLGKSLISVPSDHSKAIVARVATNTGTTTPKP